MREPTDPVSENNIGIGPLDTALDSILSMLIAATVDKPHYPPTMLYNEGWLLRLVLDWFASHRSVNHRLSFAEGADWFSEALIPSAFMARYRGDQLAESRTHADGIIGHFLIGETGKADMELLPDAAQLIVLEAKISSSLSSGVKNAPYFDQAARNVACMAEALRLSRRHPTSLVKLGFYVLAPSSQIENGIFEIEVTKDSIQDKIKKRVEGYQGEKDLWLSQWFLPTLEKASIGCISWEELIRDMRKIDPVTGASIEQFYIHCTEFNQ